MKLLTQAQDKLTSGLSNTSLVQKLKTTSLWKPEVGIVAIGIIVGVASALINDSARSSRERELEAKYQTTIIYAPKKDLMPGSVLNIEAVKTIEVLQSSVTSNMVSQSNLKIIQGKKLLTELKAGDPILLTAVDGFGTNSIAGKIPAGKRLFSLQISDKVASNGWIKPNDRVDVIATMALPGRGDTTFTLLQDVTLVSVGKSTVWGDTNLSTGSDVSFFVSPEELELLKFAQSKGEFSLALRNPNDIQTKQITDRDFGKDGVDMEKFLDSGVISKASGGAAIPVTIRGKEQRGK